MADTARVRSIDAIRRFREVLTEFAEGSNATLAAIDAEINRARGWLEHEMPAHWKQQVQLWNRRMGEARSALHRKNLQRKEGYVPDVTEEKEALRVAKERIEEAHRKLELIRRWGPELQHAISEYKGKAQALAEAAGPEAARSLALLDRMVDALEGYVAAAPPRLADRPAASSGWEHAEPEVPTALSWAPYTPGPEDGGPERPGVRDDPEPPTEPWAPVDRT
jgi:hypothetical protein